MFDRLRSAIHPRLPAAFSIGITSLGLLAMALDTMPGLTVLQQRLAAGTIVAVWACIAAEFLWRAWASASRRGRRAYIGSAEGLIDLAAASVPVLGWLLVTDPHDAALFAVVWALRYVRHSTGLPLFLRVMQRSQVALLSIASLFLAVFLTAATLAYVFERQIQPEPFGSIPRTMWWAISTLTTTGYGDIVPATIWGRLLAGWVMVGGIVMFALQAGIIANAFADELRRRHFLDTWDLVTAVPFFQSLGAAAIADIVRLLHVRYVAEGTAVVRVNEPGHAMYFIVSGEAAVQVAPEPVCLGPGSFFGEMALLFGTPRSATVVATRSSVLLVLDIADFRVLAGHRPEIVNAIEAEAKRRLEANAASQ